MTVSWWRQPLSLGATGPDVEVVQRKLKCWQNGVYDFETTARVRALQNARGLPVTGVVDEDTAEALGELPTASQMPSWYQGERKLGDEGDDIRELRRMLGLSAIPYFDRVCEDAVRRLQSEHGVKPDGHANIDVACWLGEDVPLRH